jgi:hypothetical protein
LPALALSLVVVPGNWPALSVCKRSLGNATTPTWGGVENDTFAPVDESAIVVRAIVCVDAV